VLLQTLRLKGGGENVGSAVSRYSAAFQSSANDSSNGKRNSRSSRPDKPDTDDTFLNYISDGIADED